MTRTPRTIHLECPTCQTAIPYARRLPADPPEARRASVVCPGCDPGGGGDDGGDGRTTYYDSAGRPIAPPPTVPSAAVVAAGVPAVGEPVAAAA